MVDVEDDERQRLAVPQRKRHVALESIVEIPAVEDTGEPVAERGLIEVPLKILVEIVVESELEDARRADLNLVALRERMPVDLLPVGVGAVGRPRIAEVVAAIFPFDDRVGARYSLVVDPHVGLEAAPYRGAVGFLEREHLAHAIAREHDDERSLLAAARSPCGIRLQSDGRLGHRHRHRRAARHKLATVHPTDV